ncbi:hypothetical protein [Chromohalobacter moromii]|uniref:hypothetical protein n=1 Tax=Chromohalobacter moromii TaxID=2860329 RepID=UPI003AF094E2
MIDVPRRFYQCSQYFAQQYQIYRLKRHARKKATPKAGVALLSLYFRRDTSSALFQAFEDGRHALAHADAHGRQA